MSATAAGLAIALCARAQVETLGPWTIRAAPTSASLISGGAQAVQWGTSTSFLCIKSPTQRTGAQASGGTLNLCDGSLAIDWNAFIAANPNALGNPFSAGASVQSQGWFRDPGSGAKNTSLSNAVFFTVGP